MRFAPLSAPIVVLLVATSSSSRSAPADVASPDLTIDRTTAGEDDAIDTRRRKMIKWNEFGGPVTTVRTTHGSSARPGSTLEFRSCPDASG